jgi:hypothetical protein
VGAGRSPVTCPEPWLVRGPGISTPGHFEASRRPARHVRTVCARTRRLCCGGVRTAAASAVTRTGRRTFTSRARTLHLARTRDRCVRFRARQPCRSATGRLGRDLGRLARTLCLSSRDARPLFRARRKRRRLRQGSPLSVQARIAQSLDVRAPLVVVCGGAALLGDRLAPTRLGAG